MKNKNICLFFNNNGSWGHASVACALSREFCRSGQKNLRVSLIETGTKPQSIFAFKGWTTPYFLPAASLKSFFNGLFKIIENIRPDAFLFEYYPFWRGLDNTAFRSILDFLKKRGIPIFSCATSLDWNEHLDGYLEQYFSGVFVHWPLPFKDICADTLPNQESARLKAVVGRFRAKFRFTGFILFPETGKRPDFYPEGAQVHDGKRRRILVSRGGLKDCPKLIRDIFMVARNNPDWSFLVAAGPHDFHRFDAVRLRMRGRLKNVKLVEYIYPGFERAMAQSDVSINFCGYNTMVRLLRYAKRTIVIPTQNRDQPPHARFVRNFLPCRILSPEEVRPDLLETEINGILEEPALKNPSVPAGWFSGAKNTVKAINRLI